MKPLPFNLCLVQPQGEPYFQAFQEVALLLKASLLSLGHEVECTTNSMSKEHINLLLNYAVLAHDNWMEQVFLVPYQLEQLHLMQDFAYVGSAPMRQRANVLWDYSRHNLEHMKVKGVAAEFVPIGYHASLESRPEGVVRDIPLLFYGNLNERRLKILDALERELSVPVIKLNNAYGADRDHLIQRAKIVLNIHSHPDGIYESTRLSYLLNNRVLVVTETSRDVTHERVSVPTAPPEKLAELCARLLQDTALAEATRERNYQEFGQHYAMTTILEPVIERLRPAWEAWKS